MIEINNLTSFRIDKKLLTGVAKKVLRGENKGTVSISVALVSQGEIKKLNRKFRSKNKPTDVLSFTLNEKDCLGEIVICPEIVKKNAEKFKVSFKKELTKMLIHGILHLCGYDHEKSESKAELMEGREAKYLSKVI